MEDEECQTGTWSTITNMSTTTITIITTTITKRYQFTTIALAIMTRETAATTRLSSGKIVISL